MALGVVSVSVAAVLSVALWVSMDSEPSPRPAATSASVEPAEAVELSPSSPTPEVLLDARRNEELYGLLLRNEYPAAFSGVSDRLLADLAGSICDAFRSGTSFEDAVLTAVAGGYSYEESGFMIGAGVEAFCPSMSGVMP